MALTKYRLGKLLKRNELRNTELKYTVDDVRGVLNSKGISDSSKADLSGRDLSKFLVVKPGGFVFNHRIHDKLGLGYNTSEQTFIFTNDYVAFEIDDAAKDIILPDYLYMWFLRSEFDRYVLFNSYGSATLFFNWDNMCDLEIDLPDIDIQRKFVAIYKAMIANQQSYERGLEDLKLVCDAYIDKIDKSRYEKIGRFIQRNQKKNQSVIFSKSNVKGINTNGYFIKPMRLFSGDISTFKVIGYNDFVYNSRINSTISRLSIALNEGDDLIVTPAYETFYIEEPEQLFPYYLYMLLQRDRFARTVLFNSFGSSTVFFGLDDLSEIEIPVPTIEEQKAVANVYRQYKIRHDINERLKAQIKELCPILIKGAVEEGASS